MEWLKKNKKMKIAAILILELLFLFLMWNHNYEKDLFYQNIPANEMIIVNQECGVSYVDNNIVMYSPEQERWEEGKIFACGPYMPLKKGSYDITFQYITDTDGNSYKMYCGESRYLDALYAKDKDGFFPASENTLTSQIRILKDIEAFDIQIKNNGIGSFILQSVTIQQTNKDMKYVLIGWIAVLMIFNLILIKMEKIKKIFSITNYKYTITLIGLSFLASLLIFVNGYYGGHDSTFHLLRIEGLKEAILSGQFPAKIHPTQIKGYGYATGTMYPELFLYLPALLRIAGFEIINAYKLFVLFINFATVGSAFYSFYKIFSDKQIALAGTILYVLAPYRIIDLYYRVSVGEYCAMIGLPLIAYGLYSFIRSNDLEKNEKPDWLILAIGYSIIIETHIISILMVTLFSVIIGILSIRRFLNKTNIIALLKTFLLTLGLNLWFIIPFLDYYRLPFPSYQEDICKNGISFAQLFTNLVLNDFPMHSQELEMGIKGEIPFSLGYGIILLVTGFVVFVRDKKENRRLGCISLTTGAIAICFSLYQFPWNFVIQRLPFGKLFSNIQFPWRFLEITVIAFVICACAGIQSLSGKISKRAIIMFVIVISVIGFTNITDAYMQKFDMNTYVSLDTTDIGTFHEYMLEGTSEEQLLQNGEKIIGSSELVQYSNYQKKGTNIKLDAFSTSDTEQFLELPLLMYPGYQAVNADTKEKLVVTYGTNNIVRVMLPPNFQGQIKVSFVGKWYWKIATYISLITTFVCIVAILRKKKWMKGKVQ